MAYSGYLITVGNYTIPMTLINEKTYKCTFSTMDLDSYRDANGVLHRNAVNQIPHCSFTTRQLTNSDVDALWSGIRSNYVNTKEKKVNASVYLPETDSYYSGYFYIPDTEMTIDYIKEGKVYYDPITIELIGYGG